MKRRVVITGFGLVSPLAEDAAGLHAAACAGRHAGSRQADFAVDGMPGPLAAVHAAFDAAAELGRENLRPLDRTGRLTAAAARRALADAGWGPDDLARREVGLVLGTLFGSVQTIAGFDRRSVSAGPSYAKPMDFANSVINAAAGQSGIRFNLRGPNATISGDLTAGLQALGYAYDLVRSGRVDAVLAGGAEELCVESLYGFHKLGLLCGPDIDRAVPLSPHPTGLMPAEGAALLMLESLESAERRGVRVLGEILGQGSAFDPQRGALEDGPTAALASAVAAALAEAERPARAVRCVSLGVNGSPTDPREAAAVSRALGSPRETRAIAAKAATGEAFGASGALQTVLALESLHRHRAPGVPGLQAGPALWPELHREPAELAGGLALVTSLGLQGKAAALVVERAP